MSGNKKYIRKEFRDTVFKRDGYKCCGCGFQSSKDKAEEDLDAHHIENRNLFENGGM